MHTFGFPCRIDGIVEVANKYNIPVIEDAAESLGSFYKGKHTGNFGLAGILSYNGNKTITTGGGGSASGAAPGESSSRTPGRRNRPALHQLPHGVENFRDPDLRDAAALPSFAVAPGLSARDAIPILLDQDHAAGALGSAGQGTLLLHGAFVVPWGPPFGDGRAVGLKGISGKQRLFEVVWE